MLPQIDLSSPRRALGWARKTWNGERGVDDDQVDSEGADCRTPRTMAEPSRLI